MAKLHPSDLEWPAYDENNPIDSAKREDKALAKLQKRSDSLPEGTVKGALLAFGVADGAAYYVVLIESPLTIQHVPFCDAYHIPYAHVRGLRKADILSNLRYDREMKALIG